VDKSDAESHIVLRVGEEHRIALRGLATAGYRWSGAIDGPDPGAVALELHRGELETAVKPGVSTPEEAVVRGVHAGKAIVHLAHRRPWETDAPPAQLIELRVEVTPEP
jgi:predicted secreted protein